jgi:hypothetical protein
MAVITPAFTFMAWLTSDLAYPFGAQPVPKTTSNARVELINIFFTIFPF